MPSKDFQGVSINEWTGLLCYEWAESVGKQNYFNLNGLLAPFLHVTGKQLLSFRREDFHGCVPGYGDIFHQEFQELLLERQLGPMSTVLNNQFDEFNVNTAPYDEPAWEHPESQVYTELTDVHSKHEDYMVIVEDFSSQNLSPSLSTSSAISEYAFSPQSNGEPSEEPHVHNFEQLSPTQPQKGQSSEISFSTSKPKIKKLPRRRRYSFRNNNKVNYKEQMDIEQPKDMAHSREEQSVHVLLQKIPTKTKSRDRGPKSWEFLVRLLTNASTNPALVKWEDRATFTFRIVKSEEVAQLWGSRSRKSHKDISYEHFARGLRYHYTTKALQIVSKRKLVYKCGEQAIKYLYELENTVT